jgi:hypothetical protein
MTLWLLHYRYKDFHTHGEHTGVYSTAYKAVLSLLTHLFSTKNPTIFPIRSQQEYIEYVRELRFARIRHWHLQRHTSERETLQQYVFAKGLNC